MNRQNESVAAGAADDIQRRLQGERYRALQYRRKAGNKKDIGLKNKALIEAYRGLTDDAKKQRRTCGMKAKRRATKFLDMVYTIIRIIIII